MKRLKQVLLIPFLLILILSCEKENVTNWDTLLPGNYAGDLNIKSVIDSSWEKSRIFSSGTYTVYEWHNDTTISANAFVSSKEDGFEVVFEDNGIMQMEAVSFYKLDWDDYGPEFVARHKPDLSNTRGSISIGNEITLWIDYNLLTPYDSAFSVSFKGTKSPL